MSTRKEARLLDEVIGYMRLHHYYSIHAERTYCEWIRKDLVYSLALRPTAIPGCAAGVHCPARRLSRRVPPTGPERTQDAAAIFTVRQAMAAVFVGAGIVRTVGRLILTYTGWSNKRGALGRQTLHDGHRCSGPVMGRILLTFKARRSSGIGRRQPCLED